jgi:hypothetical protein
MTSKEQFRIKVEDTAFHQMGKADMTFTVDEMGMQILQALESVYPSGMDMEELRKRINGYSDDHYKELFSLTEEKLVSGTVTQMLRQPRPQIIRATITAQGRRVLQKRQEFTTVKIHEETLEALRALLLESLTRTTLPTEQRGALKKAIESVPTALMTEFVKTTLAASLQKAPEIWIQISEFLS